MKRLEPPTQAGEPECDGKAGIRTQVRLARKVSLSLLGHAARREGGCADEQAMFRSVQDTARIANTSCLRTPSSLRVSAPHDQTLPKMYPIEFRIL